MQKNSKTVVVIDAHAADGFGDKIFDREEAIKISHTLLPLCLLYEELKNKGIECISIDKFLEEPLLYTNDNVLFISFLNSEKTEKITSYNFVKPIILICLESPYIATKFYLNIRKISKIFKNVFLFKGMEKHISKDTTFFESFFPISKENSNSADIKIDYVNKRDIILIAGNKKVDNIIKKLAINIYYGFKVKTLYNKRKFLVEELADNGLIDIYGKGWDVEKSDSIKSSYKGMIEGGSKTETMSKYKFALCFENAIFPGYITEKIFDSFLAGTIPIYLGANDIENYIPENTYIDMRRFANTEDLIKYISSIDESKYNEYIKNISIYLDSAQFSKYKDISYVNRILEIVKKYQNE